MSFFKQFILPKYITISWKWPLPNAFHSWKNYDTKILQGLEFHLANKIDKINISEKIMSLWRIHKARQKIHLSICTFSRNLVSTYVKYLCFYFQKGNTCSLQYSYFIWIYFLNCSSYFISICSYLPNFSKYFRIIYYLFGYDYI